MLNRIKIFAGDEAGATAIEYSLIAALIAHAIPFLEFILSPLVTLLHEMQKRDAKKGLATLCIGGGEATAMAVELI